MTVAYRPWCRHESAPRHPMLPNLATVMVRYGMATIRVHEAEARTGNRRIVPSQVAHFRYVGPS